MIKKGNANIDGEAYRQWIVGTFMPDGELNKTDNVEIKWGTSRKGFTRDWVAAGKSTTISILVSGKFVIEFHDEKAELQNQGDYVMWGPGTYHRSEALEDSVIVTVRWSS
jgi:quercetin dioxygenase-like cupin family protein